MGLKYLCHLTLIIFIHEFCVFLLNSLFHEVGLGLWMLIRLLKIASQTIIEFLISFIVRVVLDTILSKRAFAAFSSRGEELLLRAVS